MTDNNPEVLADEIEVLAALYADTMGLTREGAIRRVEKMHDALLDAAAALRAPAVSEEAGWQPIETAKANEWALCYEPSGHPDIRGDYYAGCKIGEGDDAYWMAACGQYVTTSPEPTHCRPLPAPPTTLTEEPQS